MTAEQQHREKQIDTLNDERRVCQTGFTRSRRFNSNVQLEANVFLCLWMFRQGVHSSERYRECQEAAEAAGRG